MNTDIEDTDIENTKIGEIDYAILKSVSYGIKTIQNLNNILKIRTIVIERHLYTLITEEFLNFQFDYFVINPKGDNAIISFEKDNPIYDSINKFITSTIKQQKEQKIRNYKILDLVLLILMVILVILIMYFGQYLL